MPQGVFGEVFKSIVNAGWGVKSGGEMESPSGFFTVVEIPSHDGERTEMREAVFSEDAAGAALYDSVEPGWYFVEQTTQGITDYGRCKNKRYAYARFHLCEGIYNEWSNHVRAGD